MAKLLGKRTPRAGNTTVYFKCTVRGAAGLQYVGDGLQFEGAQVAGAVDLITAATYDGDGVLREVSTTAMAAGESKGAVTRCSVGAATLRSGTTGLAPSCTKPPCPYGTEPTARWPSTSSSPVPSGSWVAQR